MNDQDKYSRTIREFEQKAHNGDSQAQFELAGWYSEGKYVGQDKTKAETYYQLFFKQLKANPDFYIKELKLVNYRRFKDGYLDFHKQLTVLIGENGTGKTGILDVLAKQLSWFANNLKNENTKGHELEKTDISTALDAQVCKADVKLQAVNTTFTCSLAAVKPGTRSRQKGSFVEFRQLAAMYQYGLSSIDKFELPLMVYYSIERSAEVSARDFTVASREATSKSWERFDAYADSFKDRKDFSSFLSWLARVDLLDKQKLADLISKKINSDLDDTITADNELIDLVKRSQSIEKSVLPLVFEAITTFMPELKTPQVRYADASVDLLFEKSGLTISAKQLSQGEKTLMVLVGDLARRLILLNPHAAKPLEAHGIVLIDEIDVHLHPKWQQMIAPSLLEVFPNVQFIMTTHSPQVISTVKRENIREILFSSDDDVFISMPDERTYGVPSHDILQRIMDVDPQPPVKEKNQLDRLTELVDQGLGETEDAQVLFAKVKAIFGEEHPQILRLQRSSERLKRLKNFTKTQG